MVPTMTKRFALLFAAMFLACTGNAADVKNASPQEERAQAKNFASAAAWKWMYFVAVTNKKPSDIDLSQELMSGLLSSVNARSAIYTGAAIEPQYLINAKGTTAWIAMFASIAMTNKSLLTSLGKGPGYAWIAPAWMNQAFGNHVNWPQKMLRSHDLELKGYKMVAIPFVVPDNGVPLKNMVQSAKAPDGSVEVFGFHEFDESNPEGLLVEHEKIAAFIKGGRSLKR